MNVHLDFIVLNLYQRQQRSSMCFSYLVSVCVSVCVCIPMPREVQEVTMCCDCRGKCICVCGREQMPAMQRGVSAHFDCSARTDRWAGGAQVGVSMGCGGLWVMPDFSALYAPHAFILYMLQTNAPLHQFTSYCVLVSLKYCVFYKKPNLFNILYILQSELGWAVISHAQMLCWSFVQTNKLSWCMNGLSHSIRSV